MSGGEATAVVGARLHSMSREGRIDNATIVIEAGAFTAVGAGVAPPAGARVIEAAGAIVTPGLMNAATHLGLVEISAVPDTADQNGAAGALGGAFDVQYALNPNSTLLPLARADGLTRAAAVPGEPGKTPLAGLGAVLRLSEGADILDRARSGMFATISGGSGGSRGAAWRVLRACLEEAQTDASGPAPPAPADRFLGSLERAAMREALAGTVPLAIETARESDLRQALDLARDFGVRLILLGGAEAWRLADRLAQTATPVILNPFDALPASFDEIGARLDNAAMLERAGVTIAFSIPGIHFSHNAGAALREAAGVAVAHGLSWEGALRAVTINPARIWGIADHYGAVAPGLDADLAIWDGDPLEPTSSPTCVLVRGAEVSRVTRQSRLRDRYHPKHRDNPWPPAYR